MIDFNIFGYGVTSAAVMPWTLHVAGPAAWAAHPASAAQHAIPAMKRRTATATAASVNRGTI
ncbi:MAG: hypothetical protein ABW137_13055 [Mycobacterium sp.]